MDLALGTKTLRGDLSFSHTRYPLSQSCGSLPGTHQLFDRGRGLENPLLPTRQPETKFIKLPNLTYSSTFVCVPLIVVTLLQRSRLFRKCATTNSGLSGAVHCVRPLALTPSLDLRHKLRPMKVETCKSLSQPPQVIFCPWY